ncbi:TPA: hypothetical protein ACN2RH_001743 [Staphylococcus aureus]
MFKKQYFFITLALIFLMFSYLTAANIISHFPDYIIITGTSVVMLMNIINPIVEWISKKIDKSDDTYDYKGNAFIISLLVSGIITALFYYFYHDFNWLKEALKTGLIWGINTTILFVNLAIVEINNNNIEKQKEHEDKMELLYKNKKLLEENKKFKQMRVETLKETSKERIK